LVGGDRGQFAKGGCPVELLARWERQKKRNGKKEGNVSPPEAKHPLPGRADRGKKGSLRKGP